MRTNKATRHFPNGRELDWDLLSWIEDKSRHHMTENGWASPKLEVVIEDTKGEETYSSVKAAQAAQANVIHDVRQTIIMGSEQVRLPRSIYVSLRAGDEQLIPSHVSVESPGESEAEGLASVIAEYEERTRPRTPRWSKTRKLTRNRWFLGIAVTVIGTVIGGLILAAVL